MFFARSNRCIVESSGGRGFQVGQRLAIILAIDPRLCGKIEKGWKHQGGRGLGLAYDGMSAPTELLLGHRLSGVCTPPSAPDWTAGRVAARHSKGSHVDHKTQEVVRGPLDDGPSDGVGGLDRRWIMGATGLPVCWEQARAAVRTHTWGGCMGLLENENLASQPSSQKILPLHTDYNT